MAEKHRIVLTRGNAIGHEVSVKENMFGDILSDLAGGLVGGKGIASSLPS